MRNILVGIDGGGTKTNFVAVNAANGQTVATSAAGSIHTGTMGMAAAVDHLKKGIADLCLSDQDRVIGIAIGDPAIDDSDSLAGEALRIQGQQLCASEGKCLSKSDGFMALYAFSQGDPAVLLVAGTGSMCIGLKTPYRHGEENVVTVAGGWGSPTCDPGSGYSIAVSGICASMNAFDGIGQTTALCQQLLDFFKVDTPRKLIDALNSNNTPRNQIAAFAREVDACAIQGDEVARKILEEAGCVLAKYACKLAEGVDTPKIGVYGSVLLRNKTVRQVFEQQVKAVYPTIKIKQPDLPPELGAVLFAADELGIDRRNWL